MQPIATSEQSPESVMLYPLAMRERAEKMVSGHDVGHAAAV